MVFQFVENLGDRQAAERIQMRLNWKYALGLEVADPGFDHPAADHQATPLDIMLSACCARALVKARGQQRTDSTRVLANVRSLSLLECLIETMRAALAPGWLRSLCLHGSAATPSAPKTAAFPGAKPLGPSLHGRRHGRLILLDALDTEDAPAQLSGCDQVRLLRQMVI